MRQSRLVAIVAVTENGVIGKDGGMPWHLPADFAHFKRLSMGRPNILGRKLFDSLGKPLKDRTNIVLTRNQTFQASGCTVVHSPEDAIEAAGSAPEIAIIGGAEIYRLYMPYVTRIEITRIHASLPGDTFFPEITGHWSLINEIYRPADERNRYSMTFQSLERAPKAGEPPIHISPRHNLGNLHLLSK